MPPHFPSLFQPIRIGTKQAPNRIMRLATLSNAVEGGLVTERMIALYLRYARGGSGTIVTEGVRVHPSNVGHGHNIQLYETAAIPSLARLAQAVQREGALLIVQFNHNGRQHHGNSIPSNLWGPSAIACPHSGGVPHAMTKSEIAEVVAGFALSALHAKQAGCDGVELHGGQGHLVQQFMSAFSNQRDDEYGGSLENRLRFACEILTAVRERVGRDFIVGMRLGVEEFTPGGFTIEESKQAAIRLRDLGVLDYLSLTQGNFNTIDTHLPDSHYGPTPHIGLHAQIKSVAGTLPVVASTRIQTPEQAEAIIAAGQADIVGLCRALIADPEWPLKASAGRSDDIRRCISINQCWGTGGRLSCSINPTLGHELDLPAPIKVAAPKRVLVVGGGPAGLEAARVAAERGHEVILFEGRSELGGKLAGSKRHLSYHEVSYAVDFLARQARKSAIEIRLGVTADADTILAERPQAVIIATGATPYAPPLAGDGSVPVYAYDREIPAGFPGGAVVVMDQDGYFWAAALTEELARQGRKVYYVTRFMEPLRELPQVSRISTLRAFDELNVTCYDNMMVERAERGALMLRHAYNSQRSLQLADISALVWIGAQRVNDGLAQSLRERGFKNVRVVGDASAPRRLADAMREGHRAGRAVE